MSTTLTKTRPEEKGEESRSQHQGGKPHFKSSSASPSLPSITQKAEKNGQKHCGFAQVPRLVLRSAHYELSLIEKGLYTCLKDICGDFGQCFYTLRNLAQEIGTSISTLSRYIPKLRDKGLIEAEKKPGSKGHEIWHIRMVNIWPANDRTYSSDCLTEEQITVSDRNTLTMPTSFVSESNVNVSNSNTIVSDGNEDTTSHAQNCFYLNDRGIDSKNNQNKKNREEEGATPRRNTDPLPSLPPSSFQEFPFEEIGDDTAHCWQAIMAIGAHYLGLAKVSQVDAEALERKMQSYAGLVGAQEARRRIVETITFMAYSDAPSNWFRGDRRKQLSLRNVATFWDDYSRKAQEAGWSPPADKVPAWFHAPDNVAPVQEEALTGMTKAEAEQLANEIESQYPGMKMSFGDLPDNRFTLGLWINDDAWLDLFSPQDWHYPPECLQKYHLKWALEAYQQYVGVMS